MVKIIYLGWKSSRENTQAVPPQAPPESEAVSGMERSSPWGKSKPQGRQLLRHSTREALALLFNLGHFPEGHRDPGTTLCHRASDIRESEKLQIFMGL